MGEWFKEDHVNVEDNERSGCLNSDRTVEKLQVLVQSDSQPNTMELCIEKGLNLGPNDWILQDNAPANKALSANQFLAQKLITEMEHLPCSPDFALNNFWLFPEIKSALKGHRFQDKKK
jgi:hypothetical protein